MNRELRAQATIAGIQWERPSKKEGGAFLSPRQLLGGGGGGNRGIICPNAHGVVAVAVAVALAVREGVGVGST
ncbi:hypothetical protein NL676_007907 [Syzygium grande]|nr:hypothetical protein NL676_007907 [Syzygium grande]